MDADESAACNTSEYMHACVRFAIGPWFFLPHGQESWEMSTVGTEHWYHHDLRLIRMHYDKLTEKQALCLKNTREKDLAGIRKKIAARLKAAREKKMDALAADVLLSLRFVNPNHK